MKTKLCSKVVAALVATVLSSPAWADVLARESNDDSGLYVISVASVISREDCGAFRSAIQSRKRFPVLVRIESSPGGDIGAAICIGKLIRKGALPTSLDGTCDSACFLIWAAGVDRIATGDSQVGLHRPRFDHQHFASLEREIAQAEYRRLDSLVRSYLDSVNVPEVFVDRLMVTKSSSVERIAAADVLAVAGRGDPAYEEWLIAKCGELTEEEHSDLDAVKIALLRENGYLSDDQVAPDSKSESSESAEIGSKPYIQYLWDKDRSISQCERAAQMEVQAAVLRELQ